MASIIRSIISGGIDESSRVLRDRPAREHRIGRRAVAGPYVTGHVGATGGDGGGALITGAAAGYMSPRRLAFELEVSVSPDVDFPTPPFSILSIFPAPTFNVEGRMVWLQTTSSRALSTQEAAGRDHRRRRRRQRPSGDHLRLSGSNADPSQSPSPLLLPPFPDNRTMTSTETAMSLNAGGVVDYALWTHLRVGVDARYMHGFLYQPMKSAA